MNSYERVFAALNLFESDRVPIFECSIAPNIIGLLCAGGCLEDFVEKYDLDSIYHRESYLYEPVDKERGDFRDEWGIVMRLGNDIMPTPVMHPIQSERDLLKFKAPDPRAPDRLEKVALAVKRFKGQKPVVLGMSDAFAIPWKLRGMANFLLDLAVNPDFAKKIIQIVVDYNCELVNAAADVGVDIIRPTDDYAFNTGPLMSPKMWREFIQPGLRKIVEIAHSRGLKVVKHTDGLLYGLVEPILETGVDALHPIEPLPGQSLSEFKSRYGHRVCLIGNVDCKKVLTCGSTEDIEEDVKRCLREGAYKGGYMIASSNSIHSGTTPENIVTYFDTVHKLGNYPLTI